MIRDFLTTHFPQLDITFIHNADYEHNNNIFSLWLSMQVVRGKEFLLMDSDILCDPAAVVRIAQESESALALNRHECGEEEIKVIVDADGRITEISKVCSIQDAIGESVGIEKMTADYSEAIYHELQQMIEQDIVSAYYFQAGQMQVGLRTDKTLREAERILTTEGAYKKLLKSAQNTESE